MYCPLFFPIKLYLLLLVAGWIGYTVWLWYAEKIKTYFPVSCWLHPQNTQWIETHQFCVQVDNQRLLLSAHPLMKVLCCGVALPAWFCMEQSFLLNCTWETPSISLQPPTGGSVYCSCSACSLRLAQNCELRVTCQSSISISPSSDLLTTLKDAALVSLGTSPSI